jgi:hypothetical protein
LIHELGTKGLALPLDVLNEDDCVAVLSKLLEEKKCR